MTQSFTLQPGWNSIFLEVQPEDSKPASVFAGLPIDMVWAYFPTKTPLEYIQNPSEGLWNVPGWNVYLPPAKTDAVALTNLFAMSARRAYLVKISGTSAVTLNVTGVPLFGEIAWQPDGFTLTGFPLDPSTTVRFGDYFFSSPAHKSQPRYRLEPTGNWIAVSDSTVMKRGVAYWCFSNGPSNFTGPIDLKFDGSDMLDFGPTTETEKLVIANNGQTPTDVTIRNPGGLPLTVGAINPTTGVIDYTPLGTMTKNIPPGSVLVVPVAFIRPGQPTDTAGTITISGMGTMQTVVVGGQNPVAGMSNADAGLWIGTATLSAVSEPHSAAPTVLTPTPSEFTMRLILHVDGNGTARLLKEAIILQRASTGTPPTAGEFVVISDPALIGSFKTPDNHDGARFAPRVSSVAYDFNGVHVPLSGNFGGSLTGNIVMPRNHPTNPFKHRYHPDHDDLTAPPSYGTPPANLPAEQQEVWEVARALNMTFAAPVANNSPDAANTRTGTYTETITGLHNKALVTSGTFLLKKINTIAKLNPAP